MTTANQPINAANIFTHNFRVGKTFYRILFVGSATQLSARRTISTVWLLNWPGIGTHCDYIWLIKKNPIAEQKYCISMGTFASSTALRMGKKPSSAKRWQWVGSFGAQVTGKCANVSVRWKNGSEVQFQPMTKWPLAKVQDDVYLFYSIWSTHRSKTNEKPITALLLRRLTGNGFTAMCARACVCTKKNPSRLVRSNRSRIQCFHMNYFLSTLPHRKSSEYAVPHFADVRSKTANAMKHCKAYPFDFSVALLSPPLPVTKVGCAKLRLKLNI